MQIIMSVKDIYFLCEHVKLSDRFCEAFEGMTGSYHPYVVGKKTAMYPGSPASGLTRAVARHLAL